MNNPLTTLFRSLRHRAPHPRDEWFANPSVTSDDLDPAGRPATNYPHHYHAVPHMLPTGEPNRGDEMLWVETEIARHAAAGTLDEGTAHLLDASIAARLTEWEHAIVAAADQRRYITEGLRAAQTHYLTIANDEFDQAEQQHAATKNEDEHWRSLLTGRVPSN